MNKIEIGRAVVERRRTLAISQGRLSELCGVSVHTISDLETGRGNITLETLLKIADTIGYKVTVGV